MTDWFKAARDGFNKQAKEVIVLQNIVLDEFVPEEKRLIELDKAEKERVMKEERKEALPAKLTRIKDSGILFEEEEILDMTDADFEIEYNVRLGAKLEADRIADQERRDADAKKLEEEQAEVQRQKDEAERIEKARVEERERSEEALRIQKETSEREAKEAEERIEAMKKEAVDKGIREAKEAKEKIVREVQEAKDAEVARLANEKFQAFLKENEYNKDEDLTISEENGDVKLYRLVAEFKSE